MHATDTAALAGMVQGVVGVDSSRRFQEECQAAEAMPVYRRVVLLQARRSQQAHGHSTADASLSAGSSLMAKSVPDTARVDDVNSRSRKVPTVTLTTFDDPDAPQEPRRRGRMNRGQRRATSPRLHRPPQHPTPAAMNIRGAAALASHQLGKAVLASAGGGYLHDTPNAELDELRLAAVQQEAAYQQAVSAEVAEHVVHLEQSVSNMRAVAASLGVQLAPRPVWHMPGVDELLEEARLAVERGEAAEGDAGAIPGKRQPASGQPMPRGIPLHARRQGKARRIHSGFGLYTNGHGAVPATPSPGPVDINKELRTRWLEREGLRGRSTVGDASVHLGDAWAVPGGDSDSSGSHGEDEDVSGGAEDGAGSSDSESVLSAGDGGGDNHRHLSDSVLRTGRATREPNAATAAEQDGVGAMSGAAATKAPHSRVVLPLSTNVTGDALLHDVEFQSHNRGGNTGLQVYQPAATVAAMAARKLPVAGAGGVAGIVYMDGGRVTPGGIHSVPRIDAPHSPSGARDSRDVSDDTKAGVNSDGEAEGAGPEPDLAGASLESVPIAGAHNSGALARVVHMGAESVPGPVRGSHEHSASSQARGGHGVALAGPIRSPGLRPHPPGIRAPGVSAAKARKEAARAAAGPTQAHAAGRAGGHRYSGQLLVGGTRSTLAHTRPAASALHRRSHLRVRVSSSPRSSVGSGRTPSASRCGPSPDLRSWTSHSPSHARGEGNVSPLLLAGGAAFFGHGSEVYTPPSGGATPGRDATARLASPVARRARPRTVSRHGRFRGHGPTPSPVASGRRRSALMSTPLDASAGLANLAIDAETSVVRAATFAPGHTASHVHRVPS